MTKINNCKCGGLASIESNSWGNQKIVCSKCDKSLGCWSILDWHLNEEHIKEWNDKQAIKGDK